MSTKPLTPPAVPFVPVTTGQAPAGMIAAEAALLTAWLNLHWQEYDSVAYNVRVGRGVDPGPDVAESTRQGLIASSQRRIDAVLTRARLTTLVEVKVRGSLWAIGQLLGYRALYERDYPGTFALQLIQVCGSMDEDTAYACKATGIAFEVVII